MEKKNSKKHVFYYMQKSKGSNYSIKNFWCPGDPLKDSDEELLREIKEFYRREGYPPCRGDIPFESVCRLKNRFRTWKNVLLAAGIPGLNTAETQEKRKGTAKKKNDEREGNSF